MADGNDGSGLTQKELILEMRGDLKSLLEKIEEKADRRAVHAVEARVDGVDIRVMAAAERLTKVEGSIDRIEAVSKGKAALLSAILALIVMLVAVGGLLIKIAGGS